MRSGRSPALAVALEVEGEDAAAHETALASLPRRFSSVAAEEAADVRVVAGTPGEWPMLAEAALERALRAVVVAGRASADVADVSRLTAQAERAGITVVMATRFAGNRSWRAAQGRLRAEASSSYIIDSVIEWASTADHAASRAMLDQLAVISTISPDASGLRVRSASPARYLVAGVAAGVTVVLTGARCQVDAPRLQVDITGTRSRWRACFDGGAPARPAVIERHSGDGILTRPMSFESGHRAMWIDLYERLIHGAPLPGYLSIDPSHLALASDLASAGKA